MVSKEQESAPDVSASPEGWEWVNVVEEAATLVVFDTIGDTFVGMFIGSEDIVPDNPEDEAFSRFLFRGTDGDLYALNKSYKLTKAMEKVSEGSWCRITYVKDIPTGRKLQPMKDFRVDVRV